jgi:GH43 family beta-xylosidase
MNLRVSTGWLLVILISILPSARLPVAAGESGESGTYRNPLIPGNLADPAVLLHEGVYYLYATGEVDGDNGTRAYTSTNLVDWERGPVVFRPGRPHVWAPDVWRDPDTGRFYLYYTVNQTVGVAEADNPLGPFSIVRQFYERAIDAHLFRDDDGSLYLYAVQLPGFRITVQRMANPTELEGERRLIFEPESEWEKRAGHVTEGPWIIKHQDRYYMLYSGSGADTPDYAVGYATASDPLGPFTRAAHNPIVQRSEGIFGPGHGCAIQDAAGQWWHIYHQKRNDRVEWNRFIAMDPLWFDENGRLHSRATRDTPQPAPVTGHIHGLSPAQQADGWRLLFDGISTEGWRGFRQPGFPSRGWVIENGVLRKIPGVRGGDIVTVDTFDDFELSWDWWLPPGANNGVKYFIVEERGAAIGHEYQMIDDSLVDDPKGQTASFYDVSPPNPDKQPPVLGAWNHSRIVVHGNHVEHWLNGVQVLTYTLGSPEVMAGVADSKFRDVPGFGTKVRGHILLTDHTDEARFRRIMVRVPGGSP